MTQKKKRTGRSLLRHRMTAEQRVGFKHALAHGARQTAIKIRANKASIGSALVSACREIGTERVVCALEHVKNAEWSLCAIRYAPGITQPQRVRLAQTLDQYWIDHARWALKNISHLSDDEQAVLRWISNL